MNKVSSKQAVKACEFRSAGTNPELKDGFKECWKSQAGFTDADFLRPMVWQIWDFKKTDKYIRQKKYFLDQLERNDLEPQTASKPSERGMSRVDRQEIQILKYKSKDDTSEMLLEELKNEMDQWQYPLHMIDL